MKKSLMYKVLVIGIVAVLILLSVSPSINAFLSRDTTLVEIPIIKCNADGTRRQTVVSLEKWEVKELQEILKQTDDPEKHFYHLQEYSLIPDDVSLYDLRVEMQKLAERYDLTEEKLLRFENRLQGFNRDDDSFASNFFSIVEGGGYFAISLLLGLSLFVAFINRFFWDPVVDDYPSFGLPSADLINVFLIPLGWIESKSITKHFTAGGPPAGPIVILLGFVGFIWVFPFFDIFCYFHGFSIATFVWGNIALS